MAAVLAPSMHCSPYMARNAPPMQGAPLRSAAIQNMESIAEQRPPPAGSGAPSGTRRVAASSCDRARSAGTPGQRRGVTSAAGAGVHAARGNAVAAAAEAARDAANAGCRAPAREATRAGSQSRSASVGTPALRSVPGAKHAMMMGRTPPTNPAAERRETAGSNRTSPATASNAASAVGSRSMPKVGRDPSSSPTRSKAPWRSGGPGGYIGSQNVGCDAHVAHGEPAGGSPRSGNGSCPSLQGRVGTRDRPKSIGAAASRQKVVSPPTTTPNSLSRGVHQAAAPAANAKSAACHGSESAAPGCAPDRAPKRSSYHGPADEFNNAPGVPEKPVRRYSNPSVEPECSPSPCGGVQASANTDATPEVAEVDGAAPRAGEWEVFTLKRGWAPLALALQPALDAAFSSNPKGERVEILVDPAAKSWVADHNAVCESVRQRCIVYVAFPLEQRMGKVGGEPPRPVRWQPFGSKAADSTETPCRDDVAGSPGQVRGADTTVLEMNAAAGEDPADDPLMFTANPDGFILHSAVFERLQQGMSERQAGHRYADQL